MNHCDILLRSSAFQFHLLNGFFFFRFFCTVCQLISFFCDFKNEYEIIIIHKLINNLCMYECMHALKYVYHWLIAINILFKSAELLIIFYRTSISTCLLRFSLHLETYVHVCTYVYFIWLLSVQFYFFIFFCYIIKVRHTKQDYASTCYRFSFLFKGFFH